MALLGMAGALMALGIVVRETCAHPWDVTLPQAATQPAQPFGETQLTRAVVSVSDAAEASVDPAGAPMTLPPLPPSQVDTSASDAAGAADVAAADASGADDADDAGDASRDAIEDAAPGESAIADAGPP